MLRLLFLPSVADLIMKKAVKRNGVYQLYLPLNNEELILPSNRETSIKQIEYFKKKVDKDDLFLKDTKGL